MTRILVSLLPLVTACSSGLFTSGADVTAGECEGSPYDRSLDADTAEVEPVVWAEADGSTILLHLDDLVANCCPDPEAEVTRDAFDLDVAFVDLRDGEFGCDCICIMDFVVEIHENEPGTYTIDVVYNDNPLDDTTVDVI